MAPGCCWASGVRLEVEEDHLAFIPLIPSVQTLRVGFCLPVIWARVSHFSRGFFFFIGRGCASQVLNVDAVDLLIRDIMILGMLSLGCWSSIGCCWGWLHGYRILLGTFPDNKVKDFQQIQSFATCLETFPVYLESFRIKLKIFSKYKAMQLVWKLFQFIWKFSGKS